MEMVIPGWVDCYTQGTHISLLSFSPLQHQHNGWWWWSSPEGKKLSLEVATGTCLYKQND